MNLKKLSILIIALTLNSCSIFSGARLPLPPEVVYPPILGGELQCLSDNTYKKLNKRRDLCEKRVETLKAIIKSTH